MNSSHRVNSNTSDEGKPECEYTPRDDLEPDGECKPNEKGGECRQSDGECMSKSEDSLKE